MVEVKLDNFINVKSQTQVIKLVDININIIMNNIIIIIIIVDIIKIIMVIKLVIIIIKMVIMIINLNIISNMTINLLFIIINVMKELDLLNLFCLQTSMYYQILVQVNLNYQD